MKSIDGSLDQGCSKEGYTAFSLCLIGGLFLLVLTIFPVRALAQNNGGSSEEYKQLVQQLATTRAEGGTEIESRQEKALGFLDSMAISVLNGSTSPNLDAANQRLAGMTSRTPPIGENYRLVKLGGTPTAYALVANFGQGGPAAVRIYVGPPGGYALAARIDQFSPKGFSDSDIELVPVSISNAVFVIVAGRTDDLATGLFYAWQFDGHNAVSLWNSDVLEQSNYESDDNGFHLTYCGHPNDVKPGECMQMTRDLYRFQDGEWKRVETAPLPVGKAPSK